VAAAIGKELGLRAELVVGNTGELSVWLDGQKLAEKRGGQFPTADDVIAALRTARKP
jgi:hypothetical protein